MAGNAARCDEHDIESHTGPGQLRPCRQERSGGARNAPALPRRDGGYSIGDTGAGLDLDNREHLAAPRNDVDLAGRAAPVACDDPPSSHPQMNAAEKLGQIAAPARALPIRWLAI